MKALLFILLSVITSSYNIIPKRDISCLQLDLVLAGDFSGSVQGHEKFVTDAFKSLVSTLELTEEGVKIGVIGFNDYAAIYSDLNSDKVDLNYRLIAMSQSIGVGNTNLYHALQMSTEILFGKHSRNGYRKMIVIVSDGWVDYPEDCRVLISQMKQMNIGVCTILIKNGSSRPEYMQAISSDCYLESDYEGLANEIKKLDICI